MIFIRNAFLFSALLCSSLIAIPPKEESEDKIIRYIHALDRAYNAIQIHNKKIRDLEQIDDRNIKKINIAILYQYLAAPCACKILHCRDTACKTHAQLDIFFDDLNDAIRAFSNYIENYKTGGSVDPIFQARYGTLQPSSLSSQLSYVNKMARYGDAILEYHHQGNSLQSEHSLESESSFVSENAKDTLLHSSAKHTLFLDDALLQPLRQEFPSLRHSIAFLLNHDDDQESSPARKRRCIGSE